MIELDTLLSGSPAWPKVVEFFKDGEFHEEHYLVEAIKKHLRTELQKMQMEVYDFSIEDMLNGRVGGGIIGEVCQEIFDDWNKKLGFTKFGY